MSLGKSLARARKLAALTQAEVGKRMLPVVDVSVISRWEAEGARAREPRAGQLRQLALILSTSTDVLLELSPPAPPAAAADAVVLEACRVAVPPERWAALVALAGHLAANPDQRLGEALVNALNTTPDRGRLYHEPDAVLLEVFRRCACGRPAAQCAAELEAKLGQAG